MKLSDKIAAAHGKGAPWYSHARQLEAQLEVERGERDDVNQLAEHQAEVISRQKAELDQAQAEILKARAAPRLADLRPSFEVDRPVLFILAEVMARAGMREVEVDPAQIERRHDKAQVTVDRNIYKSTTVLRLTYPCTCNEAGFCYAHGTPHDKPIDAPDLVTAYQNLVSKAFDSLGGDILGDDDPAHFWLDRLDSLLNRHLIPCWLEHKGGRRRVLIIEGEPDPAIVLGEPETPCVPERDGKHEWYTDGAGGAFCRRCGLQTVKGGGLVSEVKAPDLPDPERCTVCKRNFVDSSSGFDTCDACRKGV
jgi:hypothetical protein